MYEQTDNNQIVSNSQMTTLNELMPNSTNLLYKLGSNELNSRNAYQDNVTVHHLLNDQLLSSESNSTTVTTGGSTISNILSESLMTSSNFNSSSNQANNDLRNNQIGNQKLIPSNINRAQFKTSITPNGEHIYYETVVNQLPNQRYINQKYIDSFKASFDDVSVFAYYLIV